MALILVVEDNDMNADVLLRRLKRRGFDTAWARTGVEALALVESLRPSLVLMDLSLPEMDGFEATRHLKAGPLPAVPVIALTAHALADDYHRAKKSGCDEFETKPVDFDVLLEKIQRLLAMSPAQCRQHDK